ncbi:MAG TPA: hypothetical protein VIC71_02985 [Gammaproteobacteria bacterium]|jgi:hypothetical protein
MTHRILSTAWFVVFASITAPSYAAEVEFNVGVVTESRTYERVELRKAGAVQAQPVRVSVNRVTVALEGERITGERITGEWTTGQVPGQGARSQDFPLGTDVQATTRGNKLLLRHSDGSVVQMRIVDREKPEEDDEERN